MRLDTRQCSASVVHNTNRDDLVIIKLETR